MKIIDKQPFATTPEPLQLIDVVTSLVSRAQLLEWGKTNDLSFVHVYFHFCFQSKYMIYFTSSFICISHRHVDFTTLFIIL